jgi:uncharacterized protein
MKTIFRKKILPARMKTACIAVAVCAMILGGGMFTLRADNASQRSFSAAGLRIDPLSIVKEEGLREHFSVEIAETGPHIQKGLMFRREMPRDAGMLFYFGGGEGEVSFWMKNTLIPLDMIFIRGDGRIVHIHENAVPLSLNGIPSLHPVAAVLEINGGESAARGIRPGDRVDHPYFRRIKTEGGGNKEENDEAAAPSAKAPLPKLEIEPPRAMDRDRERGLDADVQQR